jgi:hypothetical protein
MGRRAALTLSHRAAVEQTFSQVQGAAISDPSGRTFWSLFRALTANL